MKPHSSGLVPPPRVLLAEDNPTTRKIMSHWLESRGYTVVQAEDGSKAWTSAQLDCPPIVVTDWNMPQMSGIELCRSIREQHESDQVYLLIATSRDEGGDLTEAMQAGANDFLSKPVREEEFLARIRNAEIALKRLRQRAELADRDSLTGLLNRRAFIVRAEKMIRASRENRSRLACLVLDVDLFKRYNDDFGHAVGDQVLRMIADCIRRETRDSDIICRLGGDEFCILLPNVTEDDAFEIAERVRQQVACTTCKMENVAYPIKATIGIASLTEEMEDANHLINAADQVLLVAKMDGRNRTGCQSHALISKIEPKKRLANPAQSLLSTLTVSDICQTPIASMLEDEPIANARHYMISNHTDCICVVNKHSEVVGTVTERELLVASLNTSNLQQPVKSIMSFNYVLYTEKMPAQKFWESYLRNPHLKSILVDQQNRPIGLVRGKRLLSMVHSNAAENVFENN